MGRVALSTHRHVPRTDPSDRQGTLARSPCNYVLRQQAVDEHAYMGAPTVQLDISTQPLPGLRGDPDFAECADLGARRIREELDALRVLGINPIQALVVPRVLAATLVALMLTSGVTMIGIAGSFFFSVFFQGWLNMKAHSRSRTGSAHTGMMLKQDWSDNDVR
jgi:Permease MlaE